jgi:hypothetical protein
LEKDEPVFHELGWASSLPFLVANDVGERELKKTVENKKGIHPR